LWLRLKTNILYGVFIRLDIHLFSDNLDENSLDNEDGLNRMLLYLED